MSLQTIDEILFSSMAVLVLEDPPLSPMANGIPIGDVVVVVVVRCVVGVAGVPPSDPFHSLS